MTSNLVADIYSSSTACAKANYIQQEEFPLSNRPHIRVLMGSLSKPAVWKDDLVQVSTCLFLCLCSMICHFPQLTEAHDRATLLDFL